MSNLGWLALTELDDDRQSTCPCSRGKTSESWVCPEAKSIWQRGGHMRPSLSTEKKKNQAFDIMIVTVDDINQEYHKCKRWMGPQGGVNCHVTSFCLNIHETANAQPVPQTAPIHNHNTSRVFHQISFFRFEISAILRNIFTSLVLPGSIPKDCISLSIWKYFDLDLALNLNEYSYHFSCIVFSCSASSISDLV